MVFKWKDEYCCGIEEIDLQHQKLFEIGTRVYYAASAQDEHDHYDEIITVLEELKEYTIYHFSYEEKMLESHKYPNYELHKVEHDFFIKKIERIGRKDIDSAQNAAIMEIINFVADWITSHILQTDRQYVAFLANK